MKLKVLRDNLSVSLQKVNSLIGTRSTLQILNNVLLEAKDNKLILSTTDLVIRIKAEIKAEVFEQGEITIPARKFYEIVRDFPRDEIKISEVENRWIDIR